jgi:hypothetical protein
MTGTQIAFLLENEAEEGAKGMGRERRIFLEWTGTR